MIPGSAMRRLEDITGLTVATTEGGYILLVSPEISLLSTKRKEKEACQQLREFNLRRVSLLVFQKQNWLCAECGRHLPLQAHHVIFRSRWRREMGPLDCEANIRGMCSEHHEQQHR